MKKRLLLFLCIFTLLLSTAAQAEDVTADVPAPAPSAEKADTLSPFARTRSYDGRFTDVDASAWYHDAVAALYEYGLTEGVSSSAYAPEGSVTIAELVTFAARLHALERGAAIPAAAGEAWYQPYVRYLKAEKCLGDELDGHYPEAATRAQMAGVLASALSAECYDERNAEAVTVGYASHRRITDVDDYTPYQSDILRLYKWGIVGGVDEDGSFHPNDTLKRSELAALVVRMVEPSARLTLSWQSLSYRSAAGTTWGDLIAAPAEVSAAPAADDANAEARAQQARLDAVPDAADFAPIEAALPSGVVSAYAALDAAGTPTSYLFTVEGKGFGGTIQVMCVIGTDGLIRVCRTMDVSSETTTLGGQTASESYTGQYAGQDASLSGVSAISGATITSTVVVNALNSLVK